MDRVGQESRGGQCEGDAAEGHPCHLTVRGGGQRTEAGEQYVDIAAMTRLTPGAQGSIC